MKVFVHSYNLHLERNGCGFEACFMFIFNISYILVFIYVLLFVLPFQPVTIHIELIKVLLKTLILNGHKHTQ